MDKILKKLLEDGLINQKTYRTMQRWPQAKLISFLNILIEDEQISIHDEEGVSIKEIDPDEVEAALKGRYSDFGIVSSFRTQEETIDLYLEKYQPSQSTEIKRLPDGTYGEVTEYNWELAPQYQDEEQEKLTEKTEPTVPTGEIQEEMDAEEAADPEFQELTKEEPVDFASRFYSPEDFQEKGSSQTISTEQVDGNASQWELYLNYIIKGGDTPAEAWAKVTQSDPSKFGQIYKWDAEDKVRKPVVHYHVDEKGVEHFIPIPISAQPQQHIVPGTFNDLLNNGLGPDKIEHLKDVLIMSGLAKEDDFYGVGVVDSALQTLMENIVEKANTQYGHIKYESDDYYKLVNNSGNLFGSITDRLTEQQKFEWGLIGVVLSQYKGLEKKSAELLAKEKGQQALLDKPLISTQEMAANINRWVKEEIGVDATDEQVKKYTDAWISNHTEYGKQIEYANKVASIGMDIEHYLIESGRTLSIEEVKAMQDDVGAGGDVLTGIVDTRDKIPTVTDASTATFYQIQDDLSAQKDMIEAGRKKRAKQSGILQAMAGKF